MTRLGGHHYFQNGGQTFIDGGGGGNGNQAASNRVIKINLSVVTKKHITINEDILVSNFGAVHHLSN